MGEEGADELIDWSSDLLYEAYLIVRFRKYGDPLAHSTPKERAETERIVDDILNNVLS